MGQYQEHTREYIDMITKFKCITSKKLNELLLLKYIIAPGSDGAFAKLNEAYLAEYMEEL